MVLILRQDRIRKHRILTERTLNHIELHVLLIPWEGGIAVREGLIGERQVKLRQYNRGIPYMVLVPALMGRKAVLYEEERGRLSLFGTISSSLLPVTMIYKTVQYEI